MEKPLKHWLIEIAKVILVGAFIGVLIATYRMVVEYVVEASSWCFVDRIPTRMFLGALGLIGFGFLANFLIHYDGNIQGSGLPQLEMNLLHESKTIRWYSLPLMFINSLFSFFAGLPLGSEGPSTFMGGTVSLAANRLVHHEDEDDDIPLGMGTAFGVALMSPFSGFFYSFEECLNVFRFEYIWKGIVMMGTAYAMAFLILPSTPITIPVTSFFDWSFAWLFPIIILLNFFIGKCIVLGLKRMKMFFNAHYQNVFIKNRFAILYIVSAAIMVLYPSLSGSGLSLVYKTLAENMLWYVILTYLLIRFFMYLLIGNSMASGGTMIPTLALGALVGEMACKIGDLAGVDPSSHAIIIIVSMTSLFTIVNSVPLTSLALSISIGGYANIAYSILPALAVVSLSFILVKVTKSETLNKSSMKLMRTSRKVHY